jgi:hypothetical protein
MISREDVVCAIGYDGNAALVDRSAKKKYGHMTTKELVDAGFYRAAAASAIYSGNAGELELIAASFNKATGASYAADAIPKLFGVGKVNVQKTLAL